ncbi:MAG: methylmalonate-semialdehyde dehydrogenase (acylating) [Firmicutes bacterium ZCTH02-B6]|nr:MAG: methylmalonate-semialdehyde dehydrogenase (acylating) [Firmicutes bacterium ZCTH02-B6]
MAQPQADVIRLRNFIGGQWVEAEAAGSDPVYNPATGEVIAQVPLSSAADVDRAVKAAAAAFDAWRETPVFKRARLMFRYKQVLEEHFEELAALITREHGKTLDEARAELERGIEVVEFAAGIPTLIMGKTLELVGTGVDAEMYRQPLGVCVGICPYNFPAMIPMWMFPLAIACGNTFVLKPSERTPLTATRLAELLEEAGVPAGVFNVVHGARETVDALLAHEEVRAVSFVGSQPVAAYIYRTAAAYGKRVQALAGAKNHMIVLPDADLDYTTEAIVASSFGSAGQRCMAGSVLVAQQDVADNILERLVDRSNRLKIGPGDQPGVEMGPLIRDQHRERVKGYIQIGEEEGARLIFDGRKAPVPERGFFLGPTIFDGANPDMRIAREEIFGPVLTTVRVKDVEEGIALINRSAYGNGAVIFTRSGAAARAFRRHAKAGMLGINVGVPAPVAVFPFTGWRNSFYGDLHANGEDAINFYTDRKVVTARWL